MEDLEAYVIKQIENEKSTLRILDEYGTSDVVKYYHGKITGLSMVLNEICKQKNK